MQNMYTIYMLNMSSEPVSMTRVVVKMLVDDRKLNTCIWHYTHTQLKAEIKELFGKVSRKSEKHALMVNKSKTKFIVTA